MNTGVPGVPNRLVSMDPGIRACGVAVFEGGLLVFATLARNQSKGLSSQVSTVRAMAREAFFVLKENGYHDTDTLVVEWPQIYQAGKGKGDPNQLTPLAGVDAAVAAYFNSASVVSYYPREWKGTIDGDACIERIQRALSGEELAKVDPKVPASLVHNVWDAVGIGLKWLQRFERHRVFPR